MGNTFTFSNKESICVNSKPTQTKILSKWMNQWNPQNLQITECGNSQSPFGRKSDIVSILSSDIIVPARKGAKQEDCDDVQIITTHINGSIMSHHVHIEQTTNQKTNKKPKILTESELAFQAKGLELTGTSTSTDGRYCIIPGFFGNTEMYVFDFANQTKRFLQGSNGNVVCTRFLYRGLNHYGVDNEETHYKLCKDMYVVGTGNTSIYITDIATNESFYARHSNHENAIPNAYVDSVVRNNRVYIYISGGDHNNGFGAFGKAIVFDITKALMRYRNRDLLVHTLSSNASIFGTPIDDIYHNMTKFQENIGALDDKIVYEMISHQFVVSNTAEFVCYCGDNNGRIIVCQLCNEHVNGDAVDLHYKEIETVVLNNKVSCIRWLDQDTFIVGINDIGNTFLPVFHIAPWITAFELSNILHDYMTNTNFSTYVFAIAILEYLSDCYAIERYDIQREFGGAVNSLCFNQEVNDGKGMLCVVNKNHKLELFTPLHNNC
eukprot:277968_1